MAEIDFATVTDFTKPARELIVELFNLKHGTSYLTDQFVMSLPNTGTVEGKNTDLILYGQQSTGLTGSVTIHYNRLAAHEFLAGQDNFIYRTDEILVSELLPLINEKYKINIEKSDIFDATLPQLDPNIPLDNKEFALTFKGSALVYFGSIVLRVQQAGTDIGEEHPDGEMNGFVFPEQ